MKCPHCGVHIHEKWGTHNFKDQNDYSTDWAYRRCECPSCREEIIETTHGFWNNGKYFEKGWMLFHPKGASRGPVPKEVPDPITQDYLEACDVLSISAKASAALSRRCLQNVLRGNGYKAKDLAKEIDLLLNETDARKAIPLTLRATIDGIRNFGNFSAHPINDTTTLQIIDVEPHEAEWCLEILEEAFQHFYVRPAEAKARKAALDAKLKSAGKPASK
ncbi:hypothetical protein BH10PSE11_BH10PSE11_34370 [soil metagenome]